MLDGPLLIRWTIRAALGLYAAACFVLIVGPGRSRWRHAAHWLWTLGCALYLLHVACAFHFEHGWSHAAAYDDTARRTQGLFGRAWGEGLYVNYLFTAAWTADVLWWWAVPRSHARRPRAVTLALHGFLLFVVINATIVFETGTVRWTACGAVGVLAVAGVLRRYRGRASLPGVGDQVESD